MKDHDSDATCQKRYGLELVLVDVDGTRYFRDRHGCITNKRGELVTIEEEQAVRAHLLEMARAAAVEAAKELRKGVGV